MNQWEIAIKKFCPDAKVVQLKPGIKSEKGKEKAKQDFEDSDIYIVNAINLPKFNFSKISFVIIDELHLIITEVLSNGLNNLNPRYLLGLSATPYRTDGLDGMIDCYFGEERITRELDRKHTVYRIFTKYKPEFILNKMGGVDWNSLLNSQSYNTERNEFIIDIVEHFKDRTFLLLVKRVDQGRMLCELMDEKGIKYDSLLGKEKYLESDKRVLVATSGKASVGFDCPKLNTLLLCCDFGNTTNGTSGGHFVQILGRIMRRQDGPEPTVFDLVDIHPSLKNHWSDRSKVYKRHGGSVKDFYKTFLNFTK
jgi:superfamily II DNA or RNA helicase